MPLWMILALATLTACSVMLLAYWSLVLAHIVLTVRQVPTLRAGLRARAATGGAVLPRVCIIVPAHNEEAVISDLARSLAGQDYPRDRLSFLFALDRCTDQTRERIQEAFAGSGGERVEIIEITECPPEWAGKVNALCTALSRSGLAAEAELLLFADADTVFEPSCTRAAVGLLQERGLDLLTLLSTQRTKTWYEWLVQPATCLELIRQYPIRKANADRRRRPFANGQFMLFRREAYERIGGHACVKDQIFEDVHIARAASGHGLRIGVHLADGLLHCRMYESWPEYQRGWKRIFVEAANVKLSRLRKHAWRTRVVGTVLPAAAVGSVIAGAAAQRSWPEELLPGLAMWAGIAGAAMFASAVVATLRLSRTPLPAALLFPVGAWMTGGILQAAARDLAEDRPILWGGRAYRRAVR